MFHIVVFDKTNEVEVVPSVWIKNGECMWPPNKSDITKAVKSQESPGDDWKPHKARIIFTSFGYKEARRKLPLAVDHADIDQTDGGNSPITFQKENDSEMEGHQKEPKSKKGRHALPNAPVITREQISPVVDNLHLSGQSSPDLHSHGQSSPDVNPHGQSSPDVSPHGQSSPDVSPHGQSSPDVNPHGQSSPDVSPHGQSSPHLRPHSQMSHNLRPSCYYSLNMYADGHSTPEIHSSPQTSTTMLSSGWHVRSESCTSVLLRNILTKQEMLMDQLRIIFKTLQCMQSSQETEIGLDRNLLPLKDLSSLQNMEDNLWSTPDLHKKLVNTLALKGGMDVQECVWRIMHGLCTNSLVRKVNMRGVNEKTVFLRLQIRDVVIAAVRRNRLTSEATEKEIDSTVKRWLYLAPDRDGGRKERMKNKVSEESTTG
ncbi:uncharacterized protein LOC113085053 isoform X1 [Tachysurus ichikawai]